MAPADGACSLWLGTVRGRSLVVRVHDSFEKNMALQQFCSRTIDIIQSNKKFLCHDLKSAVSVVLTMKASCKQFSLNLIDVALGREDKTTYVSFYCYR